MKNKALARYLHPQVIAEVGGFEFNPKGLVEGSQAGAHKSPFHGFSVEFAGHREYIPGDDPKHIDWVVYYKRERYMIKQYEAETNLVAQILMDVSESMKFASGEISKKDYACYLATSLIYLVTKARDKAGLAMFDENVTNYIPPSNSLSSVYKISKILEDVELRKKTDISRPLMEFASLCGHRQIVILISDFLTDLDRLGEGLSRLRFNNHEIVLFHVLDNAELTFPLEGRVKFKGLEGYPELLMTPKQIRKAYLKKIEEHNARLREICDRNQAEYVLADTSRPVQELLYGYMTSRLTHLNH